MFTHFFNPVVQIPGTIIQQYNDVMRRADIVKFVCKSYSRACFQIRNEWMVDHSHRVIAVFTGESGGTKNTVDYAILKRVPLVISNINKYHEIG